MLFPRLRRLSCVQSDSLRGLHGNPRKNLSILPLDSSERGELFQESFGSPSLTVSLILSLPGISFVSRSLSALWLFLPFYIRRTFVPRKKNGQRGGKKPEKMEETKRREREEGATRR